MMLDHSVGVPALRAAVKARLHAGLVLYDRAAGGRGAVLEPGIRNGYHAMTFGFTVGEMVRRAAGKSVGTFFQEAVARPLGLDFWIGLPEEIEPRVATIIRRIEMPKEPSPFFLAMMNDATSIPNRFVFNSGNWGTSGMNSRAGHAAEIPSANGITNARGLAGM
ncbi:MAG: serine hydrolase domain-containing protein [Aliidongia sp.]